MFVSAVDVVSLGLNAASGCWCCIECGSGGVVALDVGGVAGFRMYVSGVDVVAVGLNAVGSG